MENELSKGFTGIEINGVRFSNISEMLCYMDKQRERIINLEAQIEQMKCCHNCKHSRTEYEHCKTSKHEKWELKEE